MIKRAFTLIEVLISVVLIGIIMLFVSSFLGHIKIETNISKKIVKNIEKLERLYEVLYLDIFEASSIKIDYHKRYTILYLKTINSLYGIDEPFVVWLVTKRDDTLIRMESSKDISIPFKDFQAEGIFVDVAKRGCKDFVVMPSRDGKKVLVYVNFSKKENILFEQKLFAADAKRFNGR